MRYVLVGLGNIGQKRRAILGAACVATVDPFNAGADFSTLSACPVDRYDAALLAVPNEAKLELLEYCLRNGKHVLVEKPLLFPDDATGWRLDSLARAHGACWYTSYNHRYEPLIQALQERLSEGLVGRVYHARLFYGNGTVRNLAGTWREQGLGVLEDLGCHLLDLAGQWLGLQGATMSTIALQRHEAATYDRAVLMSSDGRIELEMSYLSWKNTFSVDVFGERGSLHLHGLRKWGPCVLTLRERVLPSGVPLERVVHDQGDDVTWERDLAHFAAIAPTGRTSVEDDLWISRTIRAAAPV